MLRIEVHQTKESCFSESEDSLGAFLYITLPSVFSCVFTEERIEIGQTAIKFRSSGSNFRWSVAVMFVLL